MTHRDRVLTALRHEEPDRVPMDLGGCLASTIVASCYPALRRHLGLPVHATEESLRYASLAVIDADVRAALDVDLVHAPNAFGTRKTVRVLSPLSFVDEWGVPWRKPEEGHYYVDQPPFAESASPASVERHAWPTAAELVNTDGLAAALATLRRETDCAISLELRGRVMSVGQFLRGFGDWMMDLADNHAFVQALLERTTAIEIEANERILTAAGDTVDIVYTSDDLGGQEGPLLAPRAFRELFRPYFARIWGHIRSRSKAFLMHHCCGSVRPFIRDFVDLGVQVLNPVQVSAAAMDPAGLKAEFGRDLSFWGGVDTRSVMPRGTPTAVAGEVQRRLREMGHGGGYILAAVHNLQPEVPPANIVALFEAGRRWGRYPLSL
jgi:uroporphyrinogen decarboxylase